MSLLLILLSCFAPTTHDYPILYVNQTEPLKTFAIGKPQQKAKWKMKPKIRICGSTEVSIYRMAQAVKYWEAAGYDFETITKDPFSMCMTPAYGEILVTLPETGFADSHMASTRLYTHPEKGDIVKAKIHILPKYARKERVLEHELGHALGWMHYRQKFHIMHPTWQLGGYDRTGIRN
tara:strand:+ start:171 stop:704 length:534 start_codon:yes stop_codon:yes gene_type:complete